MENGKWFDPDSCLSDSYLRLHPSSRTDNLLSSSSPCFISTSSSTQKEFWLMKKLHVISLTIALVALAIAGNARTNSTDIPAAPAIGATIGGFTLPDADGKDHSLSSLKGKNGTVLIFIAVQCPVSNAYNERMEKLAQDFKARGINVVGINANATDSAADVKKHATENHLTFPILKDNGNQ